MAHGTSQIIPLASYFQDDENDPLIMTATYEFEGVPSNPIPGGIFSIPDYMSIGANSLGLNDVGLYIIYLAISDSLLTMHTSFTLHVTNSAPRQVGTISDITAP
jgi:hypothetical protein